MCALSRQATLLFSFLHPFPNGDNAKGETSKFFPSQLDSFRRNFVTQGSIQEVIKVVPLCKIDRKKKKNIKMLAYSEEIRLIINANKYNCNSIISVCEQNHSDQTVHLHSLIWVAPTHTILCKQDHSDQMVHLHSLIWMVSTHTLLTHYNKIFLRTVSFPFFSDYRTHQYRQQH